MPISLPPIGLTERKVPQRLSDMLVRPCRAACYFNEKGGCFYASNDFIPLGPGNLEYIEPGEICLHPDYEDCLPEDAINSDDFIA